MYFQNLTTASKSYFPNLEIKYKDQSPLMKNISKLMFFNKTFMTQYTTTIGSTVYYPSEDYVKKHDLSSCITLLHELMHINDARNIGALLFSFLYACPQILILLALPLFLLSWKIALPLLLISLLPLPAYFRMKYEKRAYISSLYVIYILSKKFGFAPVLETQKKYFVKQFKTSSYYYMWLFSDLDKEFDNAVMKILAGQRPFDDKFFNILDSLMSSI